jgi:hypothetical protein
MLVHEGWVHVCGRRLLVCEAVVSVDPFARWAVVALGHGACDCCCEAHVRVSGAPGADFAVCW